jgi:hypothetical protein
MAISLELENAIRGSIHSAGGSLELIDLCNAVAALSSAEADYIDGVTAGTVTASKALVVDANKTIDVLTITKPKMVVTQVTAVGSVQSLATNSLAPGLNVIAGGGTDLGVKLPTAEAGLVVIVKNATASAALIYGDVTATIINALATSTGFSVATTKTTTLICENTTRWWTVPLAIA